MMNKQLIILELLQINNVGVFNVFLLLFSNCCEIEKAGMDDPNLTHIHTYGFLILWMGFWFRGHCTNGVGWPSKAKQSKIIERSV